MLEFIDVFLEGELRPRITRCSFEARPGEILGLVGPSRAGKTSILEIAAGLASPSRGRVLLGGVDVTRRPRQRLQAAGLLDERPLAPDELTGARWLDLALDLDGAPRRDRRAQIERAQRRFNAPLEPVIATLSQGGQRALALTRLWARAPQLYLLDCPDASLDGEGLRRLHRALDALREARATVILTARAPHLAATACDRVLCLEEGQVVATLTREAPDLAAQIAAAQGWTR